MIMRIVALALLVAAAPARAAEVAFIGFSADGKYVAFRESGVGEGSGLPWAAITFVDVAKNDFAAKRVNVELTDGDAVLEQAVGAANAKAGPTMRKLGIEFEMFGKQVGMEGDAFVFGGKKIRISVGGLETIGADSVCNGHGPGELLAVALEPKDGPARILQKDKKLPKSRACAREYTLHAAFLHQDALLLLIAYNEPGFEGQEQKRYMGVTARLGAAK